jgi:hypothetical protein
MRAQQRTALAGGARLNVRVAAHALDRQRQLELLQPLGLVAAGRAAKAPLSSNRGGALRACWRPGGAATRARAHLCGQLLVLRHPQACPRVLEPGWPRRDSAQRLGVQRPHARAQMLNRRARRGARHCSAAQARSGSER